MSKLNFQSTRRQFNLIVSILLAVFTALTVVFLLMCTISMFAPEMFNKIELGFHEKPFYDVRILNIFGGSYLKISWISITSFKKVALLLAYSIPILLLGYVTAVLYQLRKIIKRGIKQTPFTNITSERIQNIAWIFVIYTILLAIIKMIIYQWYKPLQAIFYINWTTLILAFIFFILAGIFRYGCYLQTEYDETL